MSEEKRCQPYSKQILIVEDDTDTAEMILMLLESQSYQARWATTADTALRMLSPAIASEEQWNRPDLILLDLMLHDMSGDEMIKRLREMTQTVPPIIVLSAKPPQAIEKIALSIEAAAVVRKPFAVEKLLASISEVLSQSESSHKTQGQGGFP